MAVRSTFIRLLTMWNKSRGLNTFRRYCNCYISIQHYVLNKNIKGRGRSRGAAMSGLGRA